MPRLWTALLLWVTICPFASAQAPNGALNPVVTVLGNDAPYSFPEKLIVAPGGDLYLLDTELSNIFRIKRTTGVISRLCHPKAPVTVTELTVDARGGIWVLDSYKARIVKLGQQCEALGSFPVRNTPLRLLANRFGELIVLTGEGPTLFDVYGADGKLPGYGDPVADSELNDGRLISDGVGGLFFSFNYPPLIRHYSRAGKLLAQFEPETGVALAPPNVTSKRQGHQLMVTSQYQLGVLDVAVDRRGRLYLLLSGRDKIQALTQGSRKLLVTTSKGKVLGRFDIQEAGFHRLGAAGDVLFLLRNRRALRLEMYKFPLAS
jgi:hypothetical protein